jgi:hypothetical protein
MMLRNTQALIFKKMKLLFLLSSLALFTLVHCDEMHFDQTSTVATTTTTTTATRMTKTTASRAKKTTGRSSSMPAPTSVTEEIKNPTENLLSSSGIIRPEVAGTHALSVGNVIADLPIANNTSQETVQGTSEPSASGDASNGHVPQASQGHVHGVSQGPMNAQAIINVVTQNGNGGPKGSTAQTISALSTEESMGDLGADSTITPTVNPSTHNPKSNLQLSSNGRKTNQVNSSGPSLFTEDETSASGNSNGATIGIIVAIVILVLIFSIAYYVSRKKRIANQQMALVKDKSATEADETAVRKASVVINMIEDIPRPILVREALGEDKSVRSPHAFNTALSIKMPDSYKPALSRPLSGPVSPLSADSSTSHRSAILDLLNGEHFLNFDPSTVTMDADENDSEAGNN